MSQYPLVPVHEVISEVISVGSEIKNIKPKDFIGLGWSSGA